MLSRLILSICTLLLMVHTSWAVPVSPTTAPLTSPANTTLSPSSNTSNVATQQQNRLELLEQANQKALAQNQELQLKNDNLTVQVQVLQSERSAQMFLYGAVTFGSGIFIGLIIYNLISSRRRSW